MKIFILNDTSIAHTGSQACMKYIYDELKEHEIVGKHICGETVIDFDKFNRAQLVLANGEGTMHDNVGKANLVMETLQLAQDRNKRTMLVNTVWQNMRRDINMPILARLDYLCVREPLSQKATGVKCDVVPDFCVGTSFEKYEPDIVDTSLRSRYAKGDTHPDCPWHGIMNHIDATEVGLSTPFRELIEELKQYDTYITGQHHGIYAAILAGIKFLPLPSNTHKIEGLIKWIGKSNPKEFILEQWSKFSLRGVVNGL